VMLYLGLHRTAQTVNQSLDTPPATTAPGGPGPVDRTVGGSAPGQVTSAPAQSLPGRVLQKAIGEKCSENLRQVRAAIEAARGADGSYPESLAAVQDISQISSCPLGHEPYVYDQKTGEVHCVHPGHEKF